MPPFSPSERLMIVGAGATLGARFPNFHAECRPPLNADFFTQLQRITSKHQPLIRDVVGDVVELFGSNFSLTLEDYFTQLEFLSEAVALAPGTSGAFSLADLRSKRDRLMGALAAVLEMSTDAAIRRSGGCSLHSSLVNELGQRDTVISFNYDCVFDHALRVHASGKWSTRHGYCFPAQYELRGGEHWDAHPAATASTRSIHLLKLHGSMNWQLPSENDPPRIYVKQRLYSLNGIPRFSVIPPVWNKDARQQPIFQHLWRNAERAIRNARHIAVVGFSFTPTDLHVESLFRVALAKANLKTLVIANPSHADRTRTREVFAKALERGAVVRQFDDFAAFVEAFPRCFT
jgi:SIR2-like domain